MHRIPGGMSRRAAAGTTLVALGLATTSVGFLSSTSATAVGNGNGTGNNGTVKVQERSGKDVPDNDPHVSCSFTVEWRGYEAEAADGGPLHSTLRFTLQNPDLDKDVRFAPAAGPGSLDPGRTELTHEVTLDQDAAGGATDLDASQVYALTFDKAPANAEQGYHVDVDITVEDSSAGNSAGKQKVFWVRPCDAPSEPESSPTDVESSPTDVESSPTDVESSPTETESSPTDVESSPTDVESSPTEAESSPTDVESSPTDTTPTVLPTESSLPPESSATESTTPTVLPTSSTAPPESSTTPTVLPTQRTASPAAAPTAVDAGLPGSGGQSGLPSSLVILLGAAMAVLGLGVGFAPVVARGKHSL